MFAELSDSLEYDPRRLLRFFKHVSRDISRPIARDDRQHIEYVPTQVVTEYIRTAVMIEGRAPDGIRYRSSRRHARTALVLFANRENIIFEKDEQPGFYQFGEDRWLRLERAVVKSVMDYDLHEWAKPAPW